MPSRRFHAKRRHGCQHCKARRVKCDAGAPCQHCVRRHEQCSNMSATSEEDSITVHSPSTVSTSPASLSEVNRISSADTGLTLLGLSYQEFYIFDHYCNIVAPTISSHDNLRRMWQQEMPHQAKNHPFLMHNILSMSAYQLCNAYSGKSRSQHETPLAVSCDKGESWQMQQRNCYKHIALEQQRLAFQTYIPSLRALTRQNREALCAASALLSLNGLASIQNRYCTTDHQLQHASAIDDWLEISVLVRGVDAVMGNAGPSIRNGFLQPLFSHLRVEAFSGEPERDLESQVQRAVPPISLSAMDALAPAIDQCTSCEADKSALHAALRLLRISFAVVVINTGHEGISMAWSNLLDPPYFQLVKQREPMALILLAYWTVAMRTFRTRWFIGELSTTILRDIAECLIRLDMRVEEEEQEQEGEREAEEQEEEEEEEKEMGQEKQELGNCTSVTSDSPQERLSKLSINPPVNKGEWRKLLEWPLRESGIHDL